MDLGKKSLIKNLTVLYIEDDLETQNIIFNILQNYFSNIVLASNGDEAFKIYMNDKIDLIITDLEMPKSNGIIFLSKLRKEDFHIPVIVFTAYTSKEYLMPCANYNIQGYIEKPITFEKLENMIDNILLYLKLSDKELFYFPNDTSYEKKNSIIRRSNENYFLNKKEKALLDLLIANKSNLVSYEQIEFLIWERQGEVMSSTALRTLVKGLRQKIGKELIQNISSMGFILKV